MKEEYFCHCPHCNSIFRLPGTSPDQRPVMFRCGACREIFDPGVNTVVKTERGFIPVSAEAVKLHTGSMHAPGFGSARSQHGDRINDGSPIPPKFGKSTAVEAGKSKTSFHGRPGQMREPAFVRNRIGQPDDPDIDPIPTKLLAPVVAEGELGWAKRNTAHEYIRDRRHPLATLAWSMVAVGLVLLFGLQVKYFYVEKFAGDASKRKYLAVFCQVANCELRPLKNPDLFELTYTKIDLHPDQPGAIRITVKLLNQVGYSQPYPDLRITLTDEDGRTVGRRSFSPDSYLSADRENMIGDGELAVLLFDLARPHEKAVGFDVDIVTDSRPVPRQG